MKRASISLDLDSEDELSKFEAWSQKWKKRMTVFSDDYGCGCCVSLYDIEGPDEAIDSIPKEIETMSEWSEGGRLGTQS